MIREFQGTRLGNLNAKRSAGTEGFIRPKQIDKEMSGNNTKPKLAGCVVLSFSRNERGNSNRTE